MNSSAAGMGGAFTLVDRPQPRRCQFEQMTGLLRGATNAFGTSKDEAKKVDAVPAQPAVK